MRYECRANRLLPIALFGIAALIGLLVIMAVVIDRMPIGPVLLCLAFVAAVCLVAVHFATDKLIVTGEEIEKSSLLIKRRALRYSTINKLAIQRGVEMRLSDGSTSIVFSALEFPKLKEAGPFLYEQLRSKSAVPTEILNQLDPS
jgi:hypothetical protein